MTRLPSSGLATAGPLITDWCDVMQRSCASRLGIGIASLTEHLSPAMLAPAEQEVLPPGVSNRRRESFTLGRVAAHRAIAQLQTDADAAVLVGPRGEPIFPSGVVGSISHSNDLALCLAGRSTELRCAGVDIQICRPLRIDIAPRICVGDELHWCSADPGNGAPRVLQLFAAKEAIYKALAPSVGRFFGFDAAFLQWDEPARTFNAKLTVDLHPEYSRGTMLRVAVVSSAEWILAGVALPAG